MRGGLFYAKAYAIESATDCMFPYVHFIFLLDLL